MNEIKPGWQTTEFWTMIVVTLVSILVQVGVIDPSGAEEVQGAATSIVSAIVAVIVPAAYTISRGLAKRG